MTRRISEPIRAFCVLRFAPRYPEQVRVHRCRNYRPLFHGKRATQTTRKFLSDGPCPLASPLQSHALGPHIMIYPLGHDHVADELLSTS